MSNVETDDKTYPFWCDYCESIKYARPPEPSNNDPYNWQPSPHYICAECLRKILAKNRDGQATDA